MDIYARLDYRQYKHLEEQLANYKDHETVHTTVTGFYHKALRLEVGDVTFEFQGPAVKEPLQGNADDEFEVFDADDGEKGIRFKNG